MRRLSIKERQLLLQLLKSCVYYNLTEKQSIKCINKILSRNISRRSYYIYKRKLYSHDVFKRLKESIYSSSLDRISMLLLNDNSDLEVRAKVNKLIADQFPDEDLSPPRSPFFSENNENMKYKLKDALEKIRQFKQMENKSNNRLNALPRNATIREEFIKCGKEACNQCPHGIYYYAYWKNKTKGNNKSKLRKKYLGATDPR